MSADNWTYCPRCTEKGEAQLAAHENTVNMLYGTVPVEQFDEARLGLAEQITAHGNRGRTFREDYDFYGAETGVLTVDYAGECTKCGLKLKFNEQHPVDGAHG